MMNYRRLAALTIAIFPLFGLRADAQALRVPKVPMSATGRPPAILTDKSEMVVKWVPVTYDKGSIVKVGAIRLPLPVMLPNGVKAAGNKALLWTRPREKGPLFWIFFSSNSESAVKGWAAKLPTGFPLPKNSYTLITPLKHRDLPGNKWYYSTNARTLFGTFNFVCLGGPHEVKDARYAKLPYAFQHLIDVKNLPNSPISHESRWVSEFIGFSADKPRK